MINLINLLRPKHYIKNFFIFLPLFFAGEIKNIELLIISTIAFISFSLTASAIYILNDLKDIKSDKKHPIKKFRPLAAGLVKKKTAINLMVVLTLLGMCLMYYISLESFLILLLYISINIGYSFKLKHIALIDVIIISSGFVIRVFVGSFSYDVSLTSWFVIMTFLIAIFLALSKRRDDVLINLRSGKKMRKSIDGYNLKLIDGTIIMMGAVIIVAYIQTTINKDFLLGFQNDYLYLTSVFVIFGIMRYLQITIVHENSGSPTEIVFKDKILQINIGLWILMFVGFIYI